MPWGDSDFQHCALFYWEMDEYLDEVRGFIEDGLALDEPVLVAIPGQKIGRIRSALTAQGAKRVQFIDMAVMGRNPGRIIPTARAWVDEQRARRCRIVGEPVWPGRSEREAAEATRHEALVNLAFADAPVTILCPYDASMLDDAVLADAKCTHPDIVEGDTHRRSDGYSDPIRVWSSTRWALPEPTNGVSRATINGDLLAARGFIAINARALGLGIARTADLVLAVNEATTNAVLHGRRPFEMRIWGEDDRIVCEVSDGGSLTDPLAGRRQPEPDWSSGRGVWLMNQLCDLVELRSLDHKTTVRLHLDLA